MSLNEVFNTVNAFYKLFGIPNDEQAIITEYVKTGSGRSKLEACADRECEFKKFAHECKPVMKVIAKMNRESEEFAAAFRFWEYLAMHVEYRSDIYEPDLLTYCKNVMALGFGAKEALIFMTVKSDPDSKQNAYYYGYYWASYDQSSKGKVFDEVYDAVFELSVEDVTFNKRLHGFFKRLMCAVLKGKSHWVRSEKEISELCSKVRFVQSIPFIPSEYKMSEEMLAEAIGRAYLYHVKLIKSKNKDWKSALIADGDKVFTYSEQMKAFGVYDYMGDINDAFSAVISDDGIREKLFTKENIAANNYEATLKRFQEVIKRYCEEDILFNGICFSPNKKVASFCSSELDKHSESLSEEFKKFAAAQTLSKNNAAIVSSLLEKWKDSSSSSGFASLAEVEAYAEKQKLESSKLLVKFDYSVPVYGNDKQTVVSEKVLKVFLDKYFSMKDVYRNRTCDNMVAHFDRASFGQFLDSVYAVWEASDFDNKLKAAVVPYCFYASNDKLYALRKQCVAFCDAGRHALTANIIRIIALNGGKYALMLVDGISNKFPYPKAKQVAKNAMAEAAEKYKIPVEVLADLIIPECGFGNDGRRSFGKDLTLTLMPDGDVRINRGDKVLKSLPSDVDAEGKKEFSAIKKDVKTVIKLQTVRFERELMFGRCWTYKNFVKLFVNHPVMRLVIANLVWGCYTAEGDLLKSFRMGLDGRAESCDYEDVELNDGDIIALVHPCDLTAEQVAAWQEYIADNEIKQPFVQMGAKICHPLKVNEKEKYIDLTEYPFNSTHIYRVAKKYEMPKTETIDGGAFDGFYLEDAEAGIGVELDMEGLYFYADPTEGNNLTIRFYLIGENGKQEFVLPEKMPTRIVSSILSSFAALMPAMQFAQNGKVVKNTFKPYDAGDIDF